MPRYRQDEIEIVWVDESAKDLAFLRETVFYSTSRHRPPRKSYGAAAYSVLDPAVRSDITRMFERRMWKARDCDPTGYVDPSDPAQIVHTHPCEGVDPLRIAPKRERDSTRPDGFPKPWRIEGRGKAL